MPPSTAQPVSVHGGVHGGVLGDVAARIAAPAAARERHLPVDDVFAGMLPDAGLVRGRVVGCGGVAAWSLAFALVARAAADGAWVAAVGVPWFGIEAAAELGVPLGRLVVVDADGGASEWAERVAAAADGFELIVTCPPVGAERAARRVRQRLQANGVVLVAVGTSAPNTAPNMGCDTELTTTHGAWLGIGHGAGRLVGRRVGVQVHGRRVPRPVERDLLLPGPDGRVAAVPALIGASGASGATVHRLDRTA